MAKKTKADGQRIERSSVLLDLDLRVPFKTEGTFPIRSNFAITLTPRQAKTLRGLFDALITEGETIKLTAERPVRMHEDAIRWLLDRIADEAGVQ